MTSTVAQLVEENLTVLRQGRALVGMLDGEAYVRNAPALSLSGVGPHLRHVIDFYERFLDGVERAEATPEDPVRVDYDARERDRKVEVDPAHAILTIDRAMERLRLVSAHPAGAPNASIEVRSDGSPWIPSSVARELQSLVSHTVHHYALIAIAVRSHGGSPDPEFGVAPSTLRHWEEERARERASSGACAR